MRTGVLSSCNSAGAGVVARISRCSRVAPICALQWHLATPRHRVPWQKRSALMQSCARRPRRAAITKMIRSMFERFTEPAIKAMMLSQSEAKAAGAREARPANLILKGPSRAAADGAHTGATWTPARKQL